MDEPQAILNTIYYDLPTPGSFGGIARLYEEAKKLNPAITLAQVKRWVKGQPTYSMFKQRRKRFNRLKILVSDIDEQWLANLLDMSWFHNDGTKFILVVIDVLSKYAWVVPLKNKSGALVSTAFKSVLNEGRKPQKLQTDQGKEFLNTSFRQLMGKYGINHFTTTDGSVKCAIVERLNRTLRERIYRYLYHKNTLRYLDALGDIVKAYNSSYHRTIGMRPNKVKDTNKDELVAKLVDPPGKPGKSLREGEFVRISRKKGATSNWAEEVFKMAKAKRTPKKYVYRIVDLMDEPIASLFYPEEVNPVDKPTTYKVEKC